MDLLKSLLLVNPPNLALEGQVSYQGTWDASANSPALASSVGTKGYYYVVSVAGSTNLNGITDWKVGDWAIYNGTSWQKVDNTDQVSSVFGRTGAVVGVSTDYSSVGITNTAIGASNPSTGAFTTLSSTGTAQLNNLKVENTDGEAYVSGPSTAGKFLTLRSGNTTGGINFRDSNYNQVGIYNQTTDTWNFAKSTTIGGNLTVSGTGSFTGQINASSGYQFRGANNTAYELMRYVGGTNNPGLFVTVTESTKKVLLTASGSVVGGQTIGIGAEGSEALTIGSSNATLAGNLTVSGTGTFTSDLTSNSIVRSAGATNTIRVRGNSQIVDFTNLAESAYVDGTIIGNTISVKGNSGSGLTVGTTGVLAVGISPSAWASSYKAVEFGGGVNQAALFANGNNDTWYVSNAYFTGSQWTRVAASTSTGVEQVNGNHKWYTGATGAAGGAVTFTELMQLNAAGNLLVNTNVDNGLGKLQVNGAISINAGTDNLTIRGINSGTARGFDLRQSGDTEARVLIRGDGRLFWGNGSGTFDTYIERNSTNLILATGSTTALTIDSSQNATFAGQTLKVSPSANDGAVNVLGRATGTNQVAASSRGATLSVTNLNNTDNNCEAVAFQNSNELAIASIVAQNVSHSGRTGKLYFNISNGAAPAEAFNIAADKTATFSGAIAIGNTVTSAASVASTHKVTISIGGVTYYLLASNV